MNDRIILKISEILKALGQPTRLKILALLAKGERCVCDIYPFVDQEQANVSKHLNMMKSPQVLNILDQASIMVHDEIAEFKEAVGDSKRRKEHGGFLAIKI
jgi:DNA-binding transcriptional ArsR family regulator